MKPEAAWPLAIGAVLAITVAANAVLLYEARQPAAGGLESDYYRRALAWDTTQAERSRSASLGWRAAAAPLANGARGWAVTLTDAAGAPLSGASVTVVGVHNLAPETPSVWALPETTPGLYAAAVEVPRAGRWELRVQAVRASERWVGVLHADAPALGTR